MSAVKNLLMERVEAITPDFDLQDQIQDAVMSLHEGYVGRIKGLIYATNGKIDPDVRSAWKNLLDLLPVNGDRLLGSL